MAHRMVFVALALALVVGASSVAGAAPTALNGSVAASTPVNFPPGSKPGNLVVRLFRGNTTNEIARYDKPLPLNVATYTFTLEPDSSQLQGSGPFILRAYILDDKRFIFYSTEVNSSAPPTSPINLRVNLVQNPGSQFLPTGSAGTWLLLAGILSVVLAGGIAFWRRRRSQVLMRPFA